MGGEQKAHDAQGTALRADWGTASGKAFRTSSPGQQRAEGPDLLSAGRDSPGALGRMEQRTRASPGAGTPRRRAALGSSTWARHPGSLRPGDPLSPPGDSEQPVLASPHPGSWIRGLAALWELRVFPAPVFWGFFLSRVY